MATDIQHLKLLFATTYSANPNEQKAGELEIRKVGIQEGAISALLQVIADETTPVATRQACVVFIKNRVYTSYLDVSTPLRADQVPIAPSDRAALKAHLLSLLATSPNRSITVQLANILKNIVARDFPDAWPTLLPDVKRLLASTHTKEVHAGCVASLEMVRAFRFRQQSDVLPKLVAELFPILVRIASHALATFPSNTSSQEIPAILHLILKTYKTSIILHLSLHQQQPDSLVAWGKLLFDVVNLSIPNEAIPNYADEDDRERSEWWKAKKWAYGILGRLFHRFGNPSQLPSSMQKEYKVFANHFVEHFAPEIFTIYLAQVEAFVEGRAWLSKKCQYRMFTFFTECVKPKSTWALLKPHFQKLVSAYVFPQLSFTPDRQELWDSDPIDYVRTSVDEYETFDTPVSAATSFLLSLAGNRTKSTFIPILGFINQVLQSKPASPQRFGALNMTAALGHLIMRHPDVKSNMENFLLQYVLPEFRSEAPYMRAIACEVLGTVEKSGLKWSDDKNLSPHFQAVTSLLDDNELPVRVQACLALTEMVTVHESVRHEVAPQVGKVITTLLRLSEETDLDILNNCMESMVEHYQTELLPVAAELTSRLCETYIRLAKDSVSADETGEGPLDVEAIMETDSGEDKTFAAMGVAKTIGTIISAVDGSPEILSQIQDFVIPIIIFTLEHKLLDLFDNVYDLADSLTFKPKIISPNMWPVFELTYTLFKAEAIDFLEEMLPALDNFVSYGSDVFKARHDYRQMALDIYTTSVTSEHLGENDAVNGSKLIESMLLNLRDHLDDALTIIIGTALAVSDKAHGASLKLSNLEVLINAVLYNPAAALHIMESIRPGSSRVFFDQWFAAINSSLTPGKKGAIEDKLPRVHDKKLTITALCALLEMDPSRIPEPVKAGWPNIVGGALQVFKTLPRALADRKELEEALQNEEETDSDDDAKVLNLNEDEEDVWDEDSAYLEMLANEGARLREKSQKQAVGEYVDESDDDESDIVEELGFTSPLDKVNAYERFKHALTAFQMNNPHMYQAATTSLGAELQTLLMEVMRIADTPEGAAV